jgi:Na+-transporting methylmalonyl-CoA/oxaloacetate decarboxylase gamma subunit
MNNMLLALEITALGMGLVFGAIILLWWMMSLLTVITAEKDVPSQRNAAVSDSENSAPVMDVNFKAQAAAIAVAIALAEQHISIEMSSAHRLSEPPTTIVSAWQLGMRTRQLYQKGPTRSPRASQDNQ